MVARRGAGALIPVKPGRVGIDRAEPVPLGDKPVERLKTAAATVSECVHDSAPPNASLADPPPPPAAAAHRPRHGRNRGGPGAAGYGRDRRPAPWAGLMVARPTDGGSALPATASCRGIADLERRAG